MVYDTLNFNFFRMNLIKFFSVLSVWTKHCYLVKKKVRKKKSKHCCLVKTLLSGRIQGLQVDLDPYQPWYSGYKLAPHKTQTNAV